MLAERKGEFEAFVVWMIGQEGASLSIKEARITCRDISPSAPVCATVVMCSFVVHHFISAACVRRCCPFLRAVPAMQNSVPSHLRPPYIHSMLFHTTSYTTSPPYIVRGIIHTIFLLPFPRPPLALDTSPSSTLQLLLVHSTPSRPTSPASPQPLAPLFTPGLNPATLVPSSTARFPIQVLALLTPPHLAAAVLSSAWNAFIKIISSPLFAFNLIVSLPS